ncbi:MAG: phage holin family protein [Actinomycetota bacterium]|nr:phage holin family protein [Actinomycetota bacterium]
MSSAQPGGDDLHERPIGELLKELSQQTTTLLKQELELAKAEMAEKGKKAGAGAGLLGGAGVAGLAALGAFTAFLILLLNTFLPAWVAAGIVTLLYAIPAAILALRGRDKVKQATPITPEQTVETVKEDVEWAKHPTRSASR